MIFIIPGELTDLNTYINAERTNRFKAAAIKKAETARVALEAGQARLPIITVYPVTIAFRWFTKDLRKDTDNVAFAKKFILDGLVVAGVLTGDGRRHVAGFDYEAFSVDKENPRVEVTII